MFIYIYIYTYIKEFTKIENVLREDMNLCVKKMILKS